MLLAHLERGVDQRLYLGVVGDLPQRQGFLRRDERRQALTSGPTANKPTLRVGPDGYGCRVATQVSVDLPSRPDSPAAARRALKGLEEHLGRDLLARVQLVVTELVANSYQSRDRRPVRVAVEVKDGTVRGVVTDTAPASTGRPATPR